MQNFNYWKKLHDSQNLEEFSSNRLGSLWLKLKSIIRKEFILGFTEKNNIKLSEKSINKQFEELFDLLSQNIENSNQLLDNYIQEENKIQVSKLETKQLVSELYKLKKFDWGGDYQNSLDKYLVTRYVKALKSYDTLISKFETEINVAVQGYVLNSWYNHWSSILIEHIFKSHSIVLQTVGQIKNVDFFINNIPFDLKVTYLPNEYIKIKRKEKGYPVEITYLKDCAKKAGIDFDKKAKESDIHYEIVEKLADKNDEFSKSVLQKIKSEKLEILNEAKQNPKILAKWLYENQGEMRFGSENRLFLVLVDSSDFENSWKLKRNFELLEPSIKHYLDNFHKKQIDDFKLSFNFKGKPNSFNVLTDIIFITK